MTKAKASLPMRSIDDLLDEAKYGGLTAAEITYVVEKIKACSPGNDRDLYPSIYILGLSQATQYRELIENFLYYPSYPMVSGMALKALCTYWNEGQNYLEQLKAFIKGVDWDADDDVKLAAIHCARDFLYQKIDNELLQLILDLFDKSNQAVYALKPNRSYYASEYSHAKIWRNVAFEALARAAGKEWEEIRNPKNNDFYKSVLECIDRKVKCNIKN